MLQTCPSGPCAGNEAQACEDPAREAKLLDAARSALAGRAGPCHLARMATLELRAHAHLARGDVAGALPLFRELAIRRREIYAPLPPGW